MYKLNKNSKASKFYEWLWNTDVTTYKSMCPYFWSWVGTVILLPIILITKAIFFLIPWKKGIAKVTDKVADTKVSKSIGKSMDYIVEQDKLWYYVGQFFKYSFFIFIGLTCLIAVFTLGIMFYKEPIATLAFIGVIAILFGIIILAIYLGLDTKFFQTIWKPFKFIGNMAYNTYKNVCPMVIWKD